jgi:hypothetical protein
VWQLHDERRQLLHLFQCVEDHCKGVDCIDVAAVIDLLYSAAEVQFGKLLYFAQLFHAVVAEAAVF